MSPSHLPLHLHLHLPIHLPPSHLILSISLFPPPWLHLPAFTSVLPSPYPSPPSSPSYPLSLLYPFCPVLSLFSLFPRPFAALFTASDVIMHFLFYDTRCELPQPPTGKMTDVQAWLESVHNSEAQLEHQSLRWVQSPPPSYQHTLWLHAVLSSRNVWSLTNWCEVDCITLILHSHLQMWKLNQYMYDVHVNGCLDGTWW